MARILRQPHKGIKVARWECKCSALVEFEKSDIHELGDGSPVHDFVVCPSCGVQITTDFLKWETKVMHKGGFLG